MGSPKSSRKNGKSPATAEEPPAPKSPRGGRGNRGANAGAEAANTPLASTANQKTTKQSNAAPSETTGVFSYLKECWSSYLLTYLLWNGILAGVVGGLCIYAWHAEIIAHFPALAHLVAQLKQYPLVQDILANSVVQEAAQRIEMFKHPDWKDFLPVVVVTGLFCVATRFCQDLSMREIQKLDKVEAQTGKEDPETIARITQKARTRTVLGFVFLAIVITQAHPDWPARWIHVARISIFVIWQLCYNFDIRPAPTLSEQLTDKWKAIGLAALQGLGGAMFSGMVPVRECFFMILIFMFDTSDRVQETIGTIVEKQEAKLLKDLPAGFFAKLLSFHSWGKQWSYLWKVYFTSKKRYYCHMVFVSCLLFVRVFAPTNPNEQLSVVYKITPFIWTWYLFWSMVGQIGDYLNARTREFIEQNYPELMETPDKIAENYYDDHNFRGEIDKLHNQAYRRIRWLSLLNMTCEIHQLTLLTG